MNQSPTEPRPAFKDPKPTAERIVQLAERVLAGDILLPRFQRNFVWNRKQILDLLDSIARNYPIGSMLLWQSRQELANERSIADLEVANSKPDYPVNYLLDGQQRLSTICGALHWAPGDPASVWNVAYDLQQQMFLHMETADEPALHVIPLRYLSAASRYFSRITGLESDLQQRAKALFDRFTDYQVATVTLGDMSIEDVAPVFERINSTGTPLTIVDLMRAATWSPTFDLADSIDDLSNSLAPKNFHGIDRKTLLRSVASAAGYGFDSASIDDLRNKSEQELKEAVQSTEKAAKRASDFLATQVGAPGDRALPYANQFVVLSEVFRLVPNPTSKQYQEIIRWFWKTTLARYFGGWNTGQMAADREAVKDFAEGKAAQIDTSATPPTSVVWSTGDFRSNSATSKMLALMLGHFQPQDLITGQSIDVDKALSWSNDKEYHHFFPKAYLKANGPKGHRPNAIANIIMLTSMSNIKIRDRAPSEYLRKIADEVGEEVLLDRLRSCMVPKAAYKAAMKDDYAGFLKARSDFLQAEALKLAGIPVSTSTAANTAIGDEDPNISD